MGKAMSFSLFMALLLELLALVALAELFKKRH
jgi:hypothetical protein